MTDDLQFTYATDKDIFDLLMSNRQRFSDSTLRSFALKRGFIYSTYTQTQRVISEISLMPHDYSSISELIKLRETGRRQEKLTCVTLPVAFSREELKQIIAYYEESCGSDEKINVQPRRAHDLYVNIEYAEIDYSKTRLIQRQKRDAAIEFITDGDATTIRMPAADKAKEIVNQIKVHAERVKLQRLEPARVELSGLNADQKTSFFMQMMREMPGYEYQTAVNMKVASNAPGVISAELDVDMEADETTEEQVIGIVNSVILSGLNLDQSEEYQSLRRKGYFLSSATWRALQRERPHDMLQFEVSFEDGREGLGFKYAARIARRLKTGLLTDKFEALEANRQPAIWRLIETTSLSFVKNIRETASKEKDAGVGALS